MEIMSWKALIEFEAGEGGDSSNQSIKLGGNRCDKDELGSKIKDSITKAMSILGSAKEIKEIQEKLSKAELKLKALEDANKAFEQSNKNLPVSDVKMEEVPKQEEEPKKRKHSRL